MFLRQPIYVNVQSLKTGQFFRFKVFTIFCVSTFLLAISYSNTNMCCCCYCIQDKVTQTNIDAHWQKIAKFKELREGLRIAQKPNIPPNLKDKPEKILYYTGIVGKKAGTDNAFTFLPLTAGLQVLLQHLTYQRNTNTKIM